jgi:hypothetical protein
MKQYRTTTLDCSVYAAIIQLFISVSLFMILNSLNAIWRLSFIVLIRYNCLGVVKEYYMHPLFGNQCIQCFLNPISLGDALPLNQDVGR